MTTTWPRNKIDLKIANYGAVVREVRQKRLNSGQELELEYCSSHVTEQDSKRMTEFATYMSEQLTKTELNAIRMHW